MVQYIDPVLMWFIIQSLLWLGFLVILLLVCVLCARDVCKTQKKSSPPTRQEKIPTSRRIFRPPSSTPITDIQLTMCTHCEATILAGATVCPHCGNLRPICTVCHHMITNSDAILSCPNCKGMAHRIHILEYLKVKGACPNCGIKLDERDLIKYMN